MSRTRPGRVRTKRDNRRPPLLLSMMKPQNINLREGETKSIVCPDCERWWRLMGETQLKIREHCARGCKGGGTDCHEHTRCPGSNQSVLLDATVERWAEAMLAADSTATGRRSARQHFKPIPAPAEPIARMSSAPGTPVEALSAYRSHLRMCRDSGKAGRCAGSYRCAEGARIAALYAELEQAEGQRVRDARVDALLARHRMARTWSRYTETTTSTTSSLAKRGGTAVEEANNAVRGRRPGSVSEFRGPEVPLCPPNQQVHDQRQAALGQQYARRNTAPSV
ncbi:hypothetical protein [Streptomyces sp. CFMR 7]|uniref:hypothetical protein n=1 Tax=Streptomyces sp. CFMR 7 TaxID=1649184 RepID=UPI0006AD1610|nr:hypothetical protein [Streptomyces sp. CFMR 7]ALC32325.1 hypothetical protein ABE83_34765 [Streptomyces sp. CFMR 7]